MKHSIVHIVDDASWGGVNRMLSFIEEQQGKTLWDRHQIIRVGRGLRTAPLIEADAIVSHTAICWKNLPLLTSLRSKHPSTPLIHIEHSYSERYVALNVEKRDRFEDLLRLSYSLFDKVVAVSSCQATWLARRGFCLPDQLATITSCVDLSTFKAAPAPKERGPVTIGAIGRLHVQKGFDILVEAFVEQAAPNMNLLVIGDGPEFANLQAKAKGDPRVIFAGKATDMVSAYASCDVVAIPSRWEPFGLVALEAMAARRPVLCARVDGLKHHVERGAVGVPQNTAEGWGELISKLSSKSAVRALPLGDAHASAEIDFAHEWNALIHRLLDKSDDRQIAA